MTVPSTPLSRRNLLRSVAVAGGLLTVPGLLAACSSGGGKTSGDVGTSNDPIEQLRVVLPSSISTLDVTREPGIVNLTIALLAQESLLTVGAGGKLEPGLAESWTQPDATTYVMDLRTDATFSDGTPLTVEDVIASIEQHSRKGSTSTFAYAFTNVKDLKKTGENQLTITLSEPDSLFAWSLSPGTLQVTSKAFLTKNAGSIGTSKTLLLGTGPYRVTSFSADSHVELERNDAWWGDAPAAASVRFEFVTDESTRLIAMREGSFDVATSVPLDQLKQWENIDGADVQSATDNSVVTLAFNTTIAPFDDRHVRAAISHSIDREAIVKSVLRGHGEVAATFPTRSEWGGLLDEAGVKKLYNDIPQYDFDLDQAKSELAKSAVPDGFSATISYPNSGPQIGKALLSLAANLEKIGVTLKVEEVTLEKWIADLGTHEAGLVLGWYFATTGDPAEYTQQLLNGDNTGVNGSNIADYSNDRVTAALRQERITTDQAERGRLLGEALVQAATDIAYQPLWWGVGATAFGPKVATKDYSPYFFLGPWAADVRSRA